MCRRMLFAVLFTVPLFAVAQNAGIVRGRVVDAETNKPLSAANVSVIGSSLGTHTREDGTFELQGVPIGPGTIRVSFIGYTQATVHYSLIDRGPVSVAVLLEQTVLPGQTIVVSATRAVERVNPVTFATLTARDLTERYSTQDIPQLLSELPSTTFYSESGNGIGYNYLSIRGFDQRRISVLVNGIPQNDPEDHDVYWLDFPDLAANLEDIQVQLGAGIAFYGPPAVGGSVNLITSNFSRTPGIDFTSGYGSFNTRKYSVAINSGMVGGQYQIYGRLSRILSDGYRENSWSDFSSYFIGAVRYDATMTTQFNFYGGPIADHLAYYGVSKEDATSHDSDRRRRNPIQRPEEIENFSQPHYELLHEWQLTDDLVLNNALFLVTGDGFFDYDGSWAPYSYFRITRENGFDVSGDPENQYITNALIRAWVSNVQIGWLPRARIGHAGGTLTIGAELRNHRSHHWGAIRWGEQLPTGVTPDYRYYEYRGAKNIFSFYAHELASLRPDLTLQLDLQYVYNRYRLYDEKFVGTDFSVPYHFLNPRVGLNYNVTDKINVYAQISRTSREPRLKNLYDAAEASTPESWGAVTPQFRTLGSGRYDFSDPLVKPEALVDLELGGGYISERFRAGMNFFSMSFTNEIIKKGQLDRFGIPVTGNAERTLHEGIEFTTSAKWNDVLEFHANATVSRNRLVRYTVFEGSAPVSLNWNTIAGFPDMLANVRATYRQHGFTLSVLLQHVGEFYTDNFQNPRARTPDPARTVDAATVMHAWVSFRPALGSLLRNLEIQVQVNNVFNKIYASHGEGDEFFPAAERNIFASLRLGL